MTWIRSSQAAALLRVSERHLRRMRDKFQTRPAGRATEYLLESLPVEAQETYFRLASPALLGAGDAEGEKSGGSSPLPGAPALSPSAPFSPHSSRPAPHSLSEDELARLNDLADALRAFQSGGHMEPPLQCMSPSTIRRKLRALEKYGLAGLARKPRADRGRARVADEKVVARIKTEFLQPYRPAAARIYADVARDFEMSGLKPPSYSFVLRKTKELDPDLVARMRIGDKNFDDKFALVTLRKKPALPRQWADADHHLCDHIVIFADGSIGRPWLTAIQDICTNEILGYVLSHEKKSTYPGAVTIGLALRGAILKKDDPAWPSRGIFENFYADLGRDFRAQYVRAACSDLGIKTVYARGYHGKSKPIERWFGVLENGIKRLPGYVGRNPETNPLHQEIGPSRSWEDLRGEIMTIDQFEAELHKWIVNDFHHAESRALKGLSPMGALEMHARNGWAPKEIRDERALDLLLMQRKAKKVQRFGIEMFGSQGAQRFFMAPELAAIVGQEVQVFWNPAKLGELIVYKEDRFLCKAQNRELLDFGADEETLKRERELKAAQRRSIQDRLDELTKQAQYPNAMARAAAEKRREEIMQEEREKIAVNAEPARPVYKLIPKFQFAAKALHDGRTIAPIKNPLSFPFDKGGKRGISDVALDAELKSSDELFKAERNPWLEDNE